jgi:sugar/nucleoside kinase (ribokinase family)
MVPQTDLLLPNETGAPHIAGAATVPDAVASLTKARAAVAIKIGARGALYASGAQRYLATPPAVSPVDATGPGRNPARGPRAPARP